MMISGEQVRLSLDEKRQLRTMTGSDPSYIKSREQLTRFVEAHLADYSGGTAEEKVLRHLLEGFIPQAVKGDDK